MKPLLKAAFGATLIAVLVYVVDWRKELTELEGVLIWPTCVALLAYALQFFVSGWKWWVALRLFGIELPLALLVRLYCVAHFIGQFLPTSVGGDAYRAYRTIDASHSRTRPIAAIVAERLVGLAALQFLGGVAACTLTERFTIARTYLLISIGSAIIGCTGWALVRRGLLKSVAARLQRLDWYEALRQDFSTTLRPDAGWPLFIGASLLFQVIAVLIVQTLFVAVNSPAMLAEVTLIVAIASLASLVPISLNGLGVTEGSIVGVAVALNLDAREALLVGILSRLLVLPLTLLCGLLYVTERGKTPVQRT